MSFTVQQGTAHTCSQPVRLAPHRRPARTTLMHPEARTNRRRASARPYRRSPSPAACFVNGCFGAAQSKVHKTLQIDVHD